MNLQATGLVGSSYNYVFKNEHINISLIKAYPLLNCGTFSWIFPKGDSIRYRKGHKEKVIDMIKSLEE